MPDSQYSINISAKLTVAQRIPREDGFNHVFHAENITDKNFKIFFVRNTKNNARLGIIASKRTLPDAVQRNRVKRVVREIFRQHNIKTKRIDLVVMVKSDDTHTAKAKDLAALFTRIEHRCASL